MYKWKMRKTQAINTSAKRNGDWDRKDNQKKLGVLWLVGYVSVDPFAAGLWSRCNDCVLTMWKLSNV